MATHNKISIRSGLSLLCSHHLSIQNIKVFLTFQFPLIVTHFIKFGSTTIDEQLLMWIPERSLRVLACRQKKLNLNMYPFPWASHIP